MDSFLKAAGKLLTAAVPHDDRAVLRWDLAGKLILVEDKLGRDFSPEFLEEYFAANPGISYVSKHTGMKVGTFSQAVGGVETILRSSFYRDYMKPLNWLHAAALFFWSQNRHELECMINLNRPETQGDFTPAELRTLRLIYPHLHAAWRRVRRLDTEHSMRGSLEQLLVTLPLPTVLLNWNFVPVYHNRAARELRALWDHGPGAERWKQSPADFQVPETLYKLCLQLKAWR